MIVKTIGEILKASTLFLQERNIERPRRMAEELVAKASSLKRIDLYLQYDRLVEEKEIAPLREWIRRLSQGEPLEYILGVVEFYGCKIAVDRRVLIPRPETEILVDHIASLIKKEAQIVWDLCTGSGCIGIALKKRFPHLSVSISDQSRDALDVARHNAKLNEVEVEIFEGDLLAPFRGKKADVIVVNPPYISMKEYFTLQKSVRDFEPKLALVGGERGGEFYERLRETLPLYLKAGAQVFMEIGYNQGQEVKALFSASIWSKREIVRDWAGKDRFFFLEKQ